MKKMSIVLLGALFGGTVLAQDSLQCVNPDVLNGLIYRGRAELRLSVSSTLPEAMSSFRAPAGFSLVGAAVRGEGTLTTVAYRTSMQREDAYAALVASFEAEGWEVEDNEPLQVFNLIGGPVSGTVCRDRERRVLRVADTNDARYPTILIPGEEEPRACHAESRGLAMMRATMGLDDVPTLSFPAGTRNAPGDPLTSGGGRSGEAYQTGVRILSRDSSGELMDHLGAQMSEQGWKVDASWSGRLSTGASWTRVADDGTTVWATIELVELGPETFDVSYTQLTPSI